MTLSRKTGVIRPSEVSVVLGAPAPPQPGQDVSLVTISGWSDGTYLNFRPLGDLIATKQGAGGEVGINLTNLSEFEIDMNLLQTSSDNGLLSTLVQIFLKTGIVVPFFMEDASGNTKATGGTAAPRKWPDFGYDQENVLNHTWTWYVAHLEPFIGGNVA